MSFSNFVKQVGGFDRNDFQAREEFQEDSKKDILDAKLEPGELVLHPEIFKKNPELLRDIFIAQMEAGQNPLASFAGSEHGQFDPTDPDGPQHFFLKKIKKWFKSASKNPWIRAMATIAASSVPGGGAWLAPLVSGGMTKAGGGSWGQAIGAAGGTYLGGEMAKGSGLSKLDMSKANPSMQLGPSTQVISSTGQHMTAGALGVQNVADLTAQSGSLANTFANKALMGGKIAGGIATAADAIPLIGKTIARGNLGVGMGMSTGESLGGLAGAMIDPPKYEMGEMPNLPAMMNPMQFPQSTLNLGLGALGNASYTGGNLGPINPLATSGLGTGAKLFSSDVPGVDYISKAVDRQGRNLERKMGTFGNSVLKADRGWSLGKGSGSQSHGILYY
jgi:hypothetical protein